MQPVSKRLNDVEVYWLLALISIVMFFLCFFLARNKPGWSSEIQVH
jgi:hypothetical protein